MSIPHATKKPTTRDSRTSTKRLEKKRVALAEEASALDRDARKAVKTRPLNSEARFKSEYARMLKYNSLLIRRMNEQLAGQLSSRDIYALSTLMSQQREVINDLRAISDMSQQVAMIQDQAVNPFVSDQTQLITDVYYHLRKLMMETTKPKETQFALSQLDDLVKQIGIGMQTSNTLLRQTISNILLGPVNTVKAKRKT